MRTGDQPSGPSTGHPVGPSIHDEVHEELTDTNDDCICDSLVDDADPDCPVHTGCDHSFHMGCSRCEAAPEWRTWDLIMAGDERLWANNEEGSYSEEGSWTDVLAEGRTVRSSADIAAMGPVRRAVVITLPGTWDTPRVIGEWLVAPSANINPESLRQVAAELLAGALHSEEADRG